VLHDPGVGGFGLATLFMVLTVSLAGIAFAAANHGRWVIAVAAAVIAAWMATVAWAALRRIRR
jgi:cobalamin synthase